MELADIEWGWWLILAPLFAFSVWGLIDSWVVAPHVGSGGSVRGMRGRLFVIATPLRAPAWAMHDLEIRQRRARDTWDARFSRRESGVPVREGWLSDGARAAIAHFFDHGLAAALDRTAARPHPMA